MRTLSISDVTLALDRTGEHALSFREKLELAKMLDRLGVSVIETAPIENTATDSLLIKSLCTAVSSAVLSVPVKLLEEQSVALTWNALKGAAAPRLQVNVPVSTVQMEYLCHKKGPAVLELLEKTVRACRELCGDVEVVLEDATRSEEAFLVSAAEKATASGADLVTLCDSAGTLLPEELAGAVKSLRAALPEGVKLGVRCADTLFMADASVIAAVRAGADEVKVISCGSGTASLERVSRVLAAREDCGVRTGVRMTELERGVSQIRRLCEAPRSKASPFDSGVREEKTELELTVHDDLRAVVKAAAVLGYDITEEDEPRVYEAFSRIAAKKGTVGARELDAIVASAALQVPQVYKLENYVINSGHTISATCHMQLRKNDKLLESVCLGDGPVDASFLAIEQIVGRHFELDDFQIQAVTEGREAMGETVVRLRSGGRVYAGRGISTDVIGSSIRAYLSAVNKIAYEEGEA